MGETIAKIKVSGLTNKNFKEIELLVDTGATYTTIPETVLEELGIKIIDNVTLELADGRIIKRDVGNIIVDIEGRVRATPVIFGKKEDAVIMGLVTLEACGLMVDPINKKLVPLPKIHHYRISRRKKERGQILPLVALTILVLSMFAFLVWNIGMLEFNRQKMQTAADAAAISSMRTKAAFYNALSMMNAGIHMFTTGAPLPMMHNIKLGSILKGMISPYSAYLSAMKAIHQGAGGGPYLSGYHAAKLNGADGSRWWPIKGGSGTGLKKRKMKFFVFKWIKIGKIQVCVPWPPFRKTFNPAYYCRDWEMSYRKAQPPHEILWTAYKTNVTFASSLIGLRKPARAYATAQAKVWLNARPNNASTWWHNGGFPRNKPEGYLGYFWVPSSIPLGYAFDARLVPVSGGIFQH